MLLTLIPIHSIHLPFFYQDVCESISLDLMCPLVMYRALQYFSPSMITLYYLSECATSAGL